MIKYNISIAPIKQKAKPEMKFVNKYFIPTGVTSTELFENIIQPNSYTWSPSSYSGTVHSDNWVSQQILALDFDNEIKKEHKPKKKVNVPDVLLKMERMNLKPNFYYYTFSHTKEHPKFRFVFLFDEPIKDKELMKLLTRRFINIFSHSEEEYGADEQNKDLARRFHGGISGEMMNENPQSLTSFIDKLNIEIVNQDNNKLRNTLNLSLDGITYNNTIRYTKERQKYGTSLEGGERISIDVIREKVKLVDEFISGKWLYHDELFALATNFRYIRGGKKLMLDIMKLYNDNGKTHYTPNNFAMITYVWGREYPPLNIKDYSRFDEDGEICDIISEVKFERGRIEVINEVEKITLKEAEYKLRAEFEKALAADDNSIYIIKSPTGIGKTKLITELIKEDTVIGLPTNKLKDEVSDRMNIEHITSPEMEDFNDENLNNNIKHYYQIGLHKKAIKMVYDVRDRISYHSEEDVRKAAEYINKLEEVKSTKKVLVTTHSRLFHTDFKHRTIIFDEDPINELLNIQQFNLKDISLIKEYSIDKVFLYLRDAELHQIIESRMFNADLEKMMDNHNLYNISSNVFDYFNSSYCVVDGAGICHYGKKTKLKENKKYIILSATASIEIYKMMYGDRVKVIDIGEVEQTGTIEQKTNRSCSREGLKKYGEKISKEVGNKPVVTFINEKNKFSNSVNDIHFGNCSGYDDLNGIDMAVVGTPHKNNIQYFLYAKLLGVLPEDRTMKFQQVEHNGFKFMFNAFNDENLRKIQLAVIEGELVQAVGRARTLRKKSKVDLYSNLPLKVSTNFIW